jgi:hypothetical protein
VREDLDLKINLIGIINKARIIKEKVTGSE